MHNNNSHKNSARRMLAVLATLALVSTACAPAAVPEVEVAEDPGTEPGRYEGVELVIAGPAGQLDFMKEKAEAWAQETGASVRVDEIPFGEINDKVMVAFATETYLADVINIGSNLGGDLMGGGFVLPVPEWAQQRAEWNDILPVFREQQLSWGGVSHALPWDGDLLMYYYRADAIDQYRGEFQEQFGRPLEPASSWQEYAELAEFFTGWDWCGQGDCYGLVELPMRGNQGWNGYLTRAAGYAKAPTDPGFFFDPDTMEARINNPGFVRALEEWAAVMEFGPPGMLTFGWIENAMSFVGGLAAQNIQWGDIGPMSKDPGMSVVEGAVGYGMAPGATEYWDPQAGEWVQPDEPNRAPFLGFGGWINMVPKTTRNAQAAFDLAAFLGSPEVLTEAAITPGTGVNPGTEATLDPAVWVGAGWPEDEAVAYLSAIGESLEHPNAVFDMRLPGFPEYKNALEVAVSEALSGAKSAQEALDAAAAEWEAITDRFDRDEQGKLYRESLGLSD